jgi:hypothetical protein
LRFNKEEDWEKGIDIFKDRIYGRFLEPISDLEKKKYTGFLIMAIDCLLIETLQQFIKGVPETPRGKNESYFKKFLISYFKEYFDDEKAKMFYRQIRCGILHQAETKENSKIKISHELPIVKFTKEKDGLIINRKKFHKKLKKAFKSYIGQLKDKTNEPLRNNFRKKMGYICRIEYQE